MRSPLFWLLLTAVLTPNPFKQGSAYAFETATRTQTELRAFTQILSETAGNSSWQQLWRNTRQARHFDPAGPQAFFTLRMLDIPDAVKATLQAPDQITPTAGTQTWVRRAFAPTQVGRHGSASLSALCVLVDWRAVPEGTSSLDEAAIGLASLLLTRPCP